MNLDRYRDLFVTEAREHLVALGRLAAAHESGLHDTDTVNELFRHAHSLKGMAATMQLSSVSTLAHAVEDLLSKLRDNPVPAGKQATVLLLAGIDSLEQMVDMVAQGGSPPPLTELIDSIRACDPFQDSGTTAPPPPQHLPPQPDEPVTAKAPDVPATVRVKTVLLDRLLTLSGELLNTRHTLEAVLDGLEASPAQQQPLGELSSLLRQLRTEVFQARMLPFGSVSERYPRMVREQARISGKEVSFRVEGEGIELDRSLLELIVEPLVHLLRNAVDHGLETPAEREQAGKPPAGLLILSVRRHADHFQIEVQDDGRGMDPELIRAQAVSRGAIDRARAERLSADESLMLVCLPGFSTAATVTETSGRGVGMDVVLNAIRSVGGSLSISSVPGRGSCFSLRLPVSIAIFPVLLAPCGTLVLALPVSAITGTLEVPEDRLIHEDDRLYLHEGDQKIPLRDLYRLFRQDKPCHPDGLQTVILTGAGGTRAGLLTDRPLGQQEIFVSPLTEPLASLHGLSGSCLLGDGRVTFVLDIAACVGPLARL